MNFRGHKTILSMMILFSLSSKVAESTHGYFPTGFGVRSIGMGGTAAANPQDSYVIATNPAGISFLENRTDTHFLLFNPTRSYSYTKPTRGHADSQRDLFFVPGFGIVKNLGCCNTVGVNIYGRGGMNTSYPNDNPIFGSGTTDQVLGLDYSQALIAPTYSQAFFNGRSSLAVSLVYGVQRIAFKGLEGFKGYSAYPDNISNHGYDYARGWGYRVGYVRKLFCNFKLGLAFASKVYMSRFHKYKGIIAQKGKFDIPAEFIAGISWEATNRLLLAFDYQYIFHRGVKSINNPIQLIQPGNLGTENGAGFGWKNISVFKVGANYTINNQWEVRGGYSNGEAPYPSNQIDANILAPGITKQNVALGTTFHVNHCYALDLALIYGVPTKIEGKSMFGLGTVKEKMRQVSFALNWTYLY